MSLPMGGGCPRLLLIAAAALAALPGAAAERLFKYRDSDGQWVYSDRAPPQGVDVEVQELPQVIAPDISVRRIDEAGSARLVVSNDYACPVELELELLGAENVAAPDGSRVRLVIAAATQLTALRVEPADPAAALRFGYQYRYILGRPGVEHAPQRPYRAPFAPARRFRIVQAPPGGATHTSSADRNAVDIEMPEGTAIYAARDGVVVDVAGEHFRGGPDVDARQANYLRILHGDGTLALYGHLRWDSIRVRPGERVKRGEYIADSGNTGFSSGPHLHFDVQVNAGLALRSVPFEFDDGRGGGQPPVAGALLEAF